MRTALVLVLVLATAGVVLAQDPSEAGIETSPGGRPTRPRASAAPEGAYDIGLQLSDRLINLIVGKVVVRRLESAPPDKRRLTGLRVTFAEGEIHLSGTFKSPPTNSTAAADFDFFVRARLALPQANQVLFTILAARVVLNGVEAFRAGPDNASAIGAWLNFLSPSITRTASRAALAAETALARGMRAPPEPAEVTDLIVIDGNKVILKILPTLLSPLFPPLTITTAAAAPGRISVRGSFR